MEPKDRLIFPLDLPDRKQAWHYVELLRNEVGLFKVGWELFMAEGPQLLLDLANNLSPAQFFLDLKLYDIPNTLRGAISSVVHGVALITIHCDLGPGALRAIVSDIGSAFKVLAVTLLTSLSGEDLRALGTPPNTRMTLPGWCSFGPNWPRPPAAAGSFAPGRRPGR